MTTELNSWADIIEYLKVLDERIDAFSDRLERADDVDEFYAITNELHQIIAVANMQTGKAVEVAEQLHQNVSALMRTTDTVGCA